MHSGPTNGGKVTVPNLWLDWSNLALLLAGLLTIVGVTGAIKKEQKARQEIAESQERTASLEVQVGVQQERAAIAESKLLAEQRGSASVRFRLQRLEKGLLPRQLTEAQVNGLADELRGLGPINVAMSQSTEVVLYASQIIEVLKAAGVLGVVFNIPTGVISGLAVYAPDAKGQRIAEILRNRGIAGGMMQKLGIVGTKLVPRRHSAIFVGEHVGMLLPGDGQQGEGIDEHGDPVPEPRP